MKKIIKLLSTISLLFVLTACFKTNINVTIDNKGKTTCTGSLYMSREVMNQLDLDIDSLISMLSEYGIDIGDDYTTRIKVEDNVEYQGIIFNLPNSSFFKVTTDDEKLMHASCDNNLSDIIFDANVLNDGDDLAFYKDLGIEATMTVRMPGRIKSTNVGIISIDKREVTIDLFEEYKDIEIVSDVLPSLELLYLLLIVVLIILAVLIFNYINKSKTHKKVKTPKRDTNIISEELLDKI